MPVKTKSTRQIELENIISDALKNPSLVEALQAFQMGQHEYARAIAGTMSVRVVSGNTSTPKGKANARMDTDKRRNRKAR
jgi:hypothetical protein